MSKLLDPSWTKTYRRMFLWRAHSSVSVVLNFRFERIPGQSPLWSRTSAWSEFQSLVAQPWSAKSHQDRFRAETLFLGCWFYSIYMFWQRSCWKQLGAEDLVVGTTFAYCVWLRSQAGHTVSFLRVVAVCTLRVALTSPQVTTWNQPEYKMRLKFCKNFGSRGISKCPDSPDLLV